MLENRLTSLPAAQDARPNTANRKPRPKERELRLMLGLVDDGTRLVPADQPTLANAETEAQKSNNGNAMINAGINF